MSKPDPLGPLMAAAQRVLDRLPRTPRHAPSCPLYPRTETVQAAADWDERPCTCGAEPERAPKVTL